MSSHLDRPIIRLRTLQYNTLIPIHTLVVVFDNGIGADKPNILSLYDRQTGGTFPLPCNDIDSKFL